MEGVLASDILEAQFGPTRLEVVEQAAHSRLIHTVVIATGQVLEVSKVRFKQPGLRQFAGIHREITAGKSMGKTFREHGVSFVRQQKSVHYQSIPAYDILFGSDRPATVVAVSILVGPDRVLYADILEIYNPAVTWPNPKTVLIIDNYDSFTYNLYQQIAGLGYAVQVAKHDAITVKEIEALAPSHIIISPGPKRPKDSGISLEVIAQFYKTVPILGVCLGHQCIGEVFGSHTVAAPRIMHGKTDSIRHDSSGLFAAMPEPFVAARYHSLAIDALPRHFKQTAWSNGDDIMAMQHDTYPLYGVQFHPESFMTESGETIMQNFLHATA